MYLIGLSGKKRSGKSTVANMIAKYYPVGSVVQIGFADALKEEIAKGCGVTVEFLDQNKDNFRLIMQGWGTDFRRKLTSDDYWISKVLTKLSKLPPNIKMAIITDVRFLNEASMIRNCQGFIFRINRPSEYSIDGHPSETDLDKYVPDIEINNDRELRDLEILVETILFRLHIIPII